MDGLNLTSLKVGFQARIVQIKNSYNDKGLKQLMNMGIVKGNIIEILAKDISGLFLLKKDNSTFGISKELADNIFVKLI